MIFFFFNKQNTKNLIKKTFLEIPVSETEFWEIPKFEIDSGVPGPTIFLTSGIHGDEISGNVILLKFCNYFEKTNLLKGKIIALIGINQNGIKNTR
jgi:predicted deacylase